MTHNVDLPLKDRMKAAFLKEDMADIHFSVGLDEATKERIPGHKLLLATASEVFCGMLFGHFEVPETIGVDDTTPEAFKLMLRYIYTDEVDLTPDNAFPVLYLAKKYLLNNLADQISQYIATAYKGESIAKVLPHLHLVDGEHAERKHLSFEADGREVLGDALKLIRFPLMSIKEFASGPARSNFLSDKEKLEIYSWYGLCASQELTTFSADTRRPLLSCNRFDVQNIVNVNGGGWSNDDDACFVNFSVIARVRFHGVAFFGRRNESVAYDVGVSLLNATSDETLATTHTMVTTEASEDTYKVLFDTPVMLEPGTQYKVNAVSTGPDSMYAQNGQREVTCEHGGSSVKFEFTDTGLRSSDQYDVSLEGHIPTIYFSFP